jgi:glutathione synthase/RimK-type ligase-like ATP-grasp enzyme
LGVSSRVAAWDDAGVDWTAAGSVVIRTPWNYTNHAEAFVDWVRRVDRFNRLQNPAAVVLWNIHKRYLLDLARAGVHTLPTTIVAKGSAPNGLDSHAGAVVAKPAIGGGARGAMRATVDDPALLAHVADLARDVDVIVQPYAESVGTRGEVSLIYFAGRYSHALRKVPKAGDFRIHQYYGGTIVDHAPSAAEFSVAERALAATPAPCLYARVDVVDFAGAPAVMELEVIEPELFLGRDPNAARNFAQAIQAHTIKAVV